MRRQPLRRLAPCTALALQMQRCLVCCQALSVRPYVPLGAKPLRFCPALRGAAPAGTAVRRLVLCQGLRQQTLAVRGQGLRKGRGHCIVVQHKGQTAVAGGDWLPCDALYIGCISCTAQSSCAGALVREKLCRQLLSSQ